MGIQISHLESRGPAYPFSAILSLTTVSSHDGEL